MIGEGYGQIAHQTLPNILLSNTSLVTKSYIARFVDDDAWVIPREVTQENPRPPSILMKIDKLIVPHDRNMYSRGQKKVAPPGISGQLPPETVGCAA